MVEEGELTFFILDIDETSTYDVSVTVYDEASNPSEIYSTQVISIRECNVDAFITNGEWQSSNLFWGKDVFSILSLIVVGCSFEQKTEQSYEHLSGTRLITCIQYEEVGFGEVFDGCKVELQFYRPNEELPQPPEPIPEGECVYYAPDEVQQRPPFNEMGLDAGDFLQLRNAERTISWFGLSTTVVWTIKCKIVMRRPIPLVKYLILWFREATILKAFQHLNCWMLWWSMSMWSCLQLSNKLRMESLVVITY